MANLRSRPMCGAERSTLTRAFPRNQRLQTVLVRNLSTNSEAQILDHSVTHPAAQFKFQHFPQLDGLRGIAVLLVVVGHGIQFAGGKFGVFAYLGQLGVLLFFELSGFLITGLLWRENETSDGIDLGAFYIRRALRLVPALLAFFLFTALLSKARLLDVTSYEFIVCLFYVRNIFGHSHAMDHLWTLSLEEQFYTFWPAAIKSIGIKRALPYAAAATLLFATARTAGI